jgi:hypothetical protein
MEDYFTWRMGDELLNHVKVLHDAVLHDAVLQVIIGHQFMQITGDIHHLLICE